MKAKSRRQPWRTALLLALSAACSPGDRPGPAADKGVRAVWTTQVEAWNRGDLEGFMAGYWKSPDLVFFSNGTETRGWQPTPDRYRARSPAQGQPTGTPGCP